MAIGDDRVGVEGLTESYTVDFTSATDTLKNTSKSVSDYVNGGVNVLNGVTNKTKDILSKPTVKEMNVDTSKLGMFESILCGKIPSLNIRWPSFDFEFDLGFDGFDIEICGKTKNINPVDTALTIVNGLSNPKKFVGELKNNTLNQLLDTEIGRQLSNFGINGIPECLMDRTKWDLINGDFAGIGSSIEERVDLHDRLNLEGCLKDIANKAGVPRIVRESALTNIFDSLTGYSDNGANAYFNNAYGNHGASALNATRNSFLKNSTGNYLPKIAFFSDTVGNGDVSNVSNIISSSSSSPTHTYNSTIKPTDVSYLRLESAMVMSSLSKMKDEEVKLVDPNKTLLAINTLDPKWNRDSDGNLTSYKLSNNKVMGTASEKMVLSKKPNVELNGVANSNLNLMDELYIINEVKYA